jgi:dCTP deaminase
LILTDREIRNSIAAGLFDIIPRPAPEAYSSTTVDLTLSPVLRIFKQPMAGMKQAIDPAAPGFNVIALLNELTRRVDIDEKDGFHLDPGALLLGWTLETVDLKDHCRLGARVEGKSSLARVGLGIHVTAPIIHTGFRAPIQLEMMNHGPLVRSRFALGSTCGFVKSFLSKHLECPIAPTKVSFLVNRPCKNARRHQPTPGRRWQVSLILKTRAHPPATSISFRQHGAWSSRQNDEAA